MTIGPPEWFARPNPDNPDDAPGLRFKCTMCGNCCSGPPGYVLFTSEEADALAKRLGVSRAHFSANYTQQTSEGRSLKEVPGPRGLDCVFIDRTTIPGKAVCSVYEDRPAQCKTWPFWPSVVRSKQSWDRHSRMCPGMNTGRLIPPEQIRIQRDACEI